ncbi:MAG: response regulator transcription factor [Acidimicrobiales bacterium]|jgi:two-component system response regulator RegX3|nr:response regulator transcription factor [Acidimicrobiales bacterium]
MIPTRVLVIDDEPSFTEALSLSLKREGFEVDTADDGVSALSAIATKLPDLVLLDVMLPGISGVDVCREIRKTSTVPIIMVTARGEEIDAVVALEVGADDYVTKPYRLRELVARMRAVLRRSSNEFVREPPSNNDQKLVQGDVTLDLERHELRVKEKLVTLALKEFELLTFLIENAGRVVTRDSLMENVWGYDYFGDTKTIDVHIKRLRTKIESNPAEPTKITTIRGLGYRYEKTKSS